MKNGPESSHSQSSQTHEVIPGPVVYLYHATIREEIQAAWYGGFISRFDLEGWARKLKFGRGVR